jgi:hypothetical protein
MNFEQLLLEAIDDCFSGVGESEKRTIYFHLEEEYKISKPDIPHRIKDFTEAIEDIFGFGAKLLEIRIMKNLFRKMDHGFLYHPPQEGLEFTKYIEIARIHNSRPITLAMCTQL